MRIVSLTSVKNEGPFLLEWLAWHRILGVTDFLVVSNDCSDGTDRLLDCLQDHGVVTHLPQVPEQGKSIQWQALHKGWHHPLRKAADWMLVSDVDEFPMIHVGDHRLTDLLAALPDGAEAVALGWRLFGNAGVGAFQDRPVTAQFTRAAPPSLFHPIAATQFKTLFRPKAFQSVGVHRPSQREGTAPVWIDGSGNPLPAEIGGAQKRLSLLGVQGNRALAEMHHYSLRSAESFIVKSDRGLPNRDTKQIDLAYWVERNFNTLDNRAALQLAEPLAQEIAALKALPGVAALHGAACDWHRAEFRRLMRQPEAYRLLCLCRHAGDSRVLKDREAASLLRMYQALETP